MAVVVPRSSSLRIPTCRQTTRVEPPTATTIIEDSSSSVHDIPLVARAQSPFAHVLARLRLDTRTPPPMYKTRRQWLEELELGEDDGNAPVEGKELAALRERDRRMKEANTRNGWIRLILIAVGAVLLIAIALGIGLGVGLNESQNSGTNKSAQNPPFPVGTWTSPISLLSQQSECTSNPATWSCALVPELVSPSTGAASFGWTIASSNKAYVQSATGGGTSSIPANLTISSPSTSNPFNVNITDVPLTYDPGNNPPSTGRLTFNITVAKSTTSAMLPNENNAPSACYFNSTIFGVGLGLNQSPVHVGMPGGVWPLLVTVTETSPGGASVPSCYEMVNGHLGPQITDGLTQQPQTEQCICSYTSAS